jgi:hypothetical protein
MGRLMNYGWPTISQVERMASHLLICKGDRKPLGVNWYEAFLARHPDYHPLDQYQRYRKWFDLYTSTIKEYGILPGDQYKNSLIP